MLASIVLVQALFVVNVAIFCTYVAVALVPSNPDTFFDPV